MRESGEDYIETIYLLSKRNGEVLGFDVANALEFSKPSVTRAMKILKSNGMIVIDDFNHITLTDEGLTKAKEIYERHKVLSQFLVDLGVSPENAAKDACRVEHVLCDESFERIKSFVAKKRNS